jgi:mRNA-decapping enzyme 1B
MALEQARKEANLRLLQRSSDPTISNILGSATHVVLYQFQQSTQTWEKSNVEGSLFLAVRPLGYLLIIVNRNSPDNFILSLERDFQLQHKDPYLIFKQQGKQQQQGQTTIIRGIWFPNPQERVEMNDLLTQVLQTLRMAPVATPDSYQAPATTTVTTASAFASTSSLVGGGGGLPSHIDPGAAMAALLSPLSLGGETSKSMGSYLATTTTTSTTAAATSPLSTIGTLQNSDNNNSNNSGGGYSQQRNMSPSGGGQSPVLDKKSLQLALLSLIQDERFLDLLHAQYLKVAHARANRSGRPPSSGSSSTS